MRLLLSVSGHADPRPCRPAAQCGAHHCGRRARRPHCAVVRAPWSRRRPCTRLAPMSVLWGVLAVLLAVVWLVTISDLMRRHLGTQRTVAWLLLVLILP